MYRATNMTVVVRRRCDDKQRATYGVDDIGDLHMAETSDRRGPKRMELHGYVWCDAMLGGDVAHTCARADGAHKIRVCVLPIDNSTEVYQTLMGRVSEAAQ